MDTARFRRTDLILLLGFVVLGILTRLPFRSQILYHWDSVNFALGIEHFDVRLHQPQPPGYVLYVLLGRLVNLAVHDPNASLVWISVLFSALAVGALFWLGRDLFDRRVGLATAFLALTGPLFWFEGEVALSYSVEAFFVAVIALCCYHLLQHDARYLLPSAILLGLAGGFRQNTLVLLLPLWLVALSGVRWRQRFLGIGVLAVVVAAWLATMVALTGGVQAYWEALRGQSAAIAGDTAAASSDNPITNMVRIGIYGFYALTLGLPALLLVLWWVIRDTRRLVKDARWQVLALWIVPSLVFYVFYVQQAGHTFTFMPAVLLLVALALVEIGRFVVARTHWRETWALVPLVLVVLANSAFFLGAPPYLLGQRKQLLNAPSWPAIRSHDVAVSSKLAFIRSNFEPADTAVYAPKFDYRLPDYYLRDYRDPSLSYEADKVAGGLALSSEVQTLVLFNEDAGIAQLDGAELHEQTVADGVVVRWLVRPTDQVFVVSAHGVSLQSEVEQ